MYSYLAIFIIYEYIRVAVYSKQKVEIKKILNKIENDVRKVYIFTGRKKRQHMRRNLNRGFFSPTSFLPRVFFFFFSSFHTVLYARPGIIRRVGKLLQFLGRVPFLRNVLYYVQEYSADLIHKILV